MRLMQETGLIRWPARARRLDGAWATLCAAVLSLPIGCQGVDYPNLLLDLEGNAVRFNEIDAIVENAELTEFQKHQALEELGIEDEILRQHYIDNADILQPEEPEPL